MYTDEHNDEESAVTVADKIPMCSVKVSTVVMFSLKQNERSVCYGIFMFSEGELYIRSSP